MAKNWSSVVNDIPKTPAKTSTPKWASVVNDIPKNMPKTTTSINPNIPSGWGVAGSGGTNVPKWVTVSVGSPTKNAGGNQFAVNPYAAPVRNPYTRPEQQGNVPSWALKISPLSNNPKAVQTSTIPGNFIQTGRPYQIGNINMQVKQPIRGVDLSQKWTQKQWADAYKKLANVGKGMSPKALKAESDRLTGTYEDWVERMARLNAGNGGTTIVDYIYPDDWGWGGGGGGGGGGWEDYGSYSNALSQWYNSLMNWSIS